MVFRFYKVYCPVQKKIVNLNKLDLNSIKENDLIDEFIKDRIL